MRVDEAAAALLRLADKHSSSLQDMSALSAWDLFIDFAEVPFAVPEVPDADGLLYQFGTHAFTGEPTFYLDLVRQFVVFGSDEYVQIAGVLPAIEE